MHIVISLKMVKKNYQGGIVYNQSKIPKLFSKSLHSPVNFVLDSPI